METAQINIKADFKTPQFLKDENPFEEIYLATREKENRIYTDKEVAFLPTISKNHPHYSEWLLREHSSRRLVSWLERKKRQLNILEIGCGNGWLSHRLSQIKDSSVSGIDINNRELDQAVRVFEGTGNLHFIRANVMNGILDDKFDIIVFAAAIQYFPHPDQVIRKMLGTLKVGGEIHILDSPFYSHDQIAGAKKRTADHYASLGYPAMSYHYFHHNINSLKSFDHKIMVRPSIFQRMIGKNNNPFPWIIIHGAGK